MTFSNVSIGRKFAAGFASILVAVALTSVTLFVILKSLDEATLINERAQKVVEYLQRAFNAVSEQDRTARGYIIARDERLRPSMTPRSRTSPQAWQRPAATPPAARTVSHSSTKSK